MTTPFPQYPVQSTTEHRVRRSRVGLIVGICVVVAVLAVAGLLVLRGVVHNKKKAASAPSATSGVTTLPAHCDFLPAATVTQLLPGAGDAEDEGGQDSGWGLTRRCQWTAPAADDGGVDNSLEVAVVALLDPSEDTRVPSPGGADAQVRSMSPELRPHPVSVPGAEQAFLGEPRDFGTPGVMRDLIQNLNARHLNVVVEVTLTWGAAPDEATMTHILTTAAQQTLATVTAR